MQNHPAMTKNMFRIDESSGLPNALRQLFEQLEWPWEILGNNLKEAIHQCIVEYQGVKISGDVSEKAFLENKDLIVVEKGARIEPFAYVQGPCFLASGSVVRHGAYIRGNCFAAEGSVIGHSTEVKDSILLKGAKAAHFAYVGNSILGQSCNLGAGTKLANFRFDGKNIPLKVDGKKIDSGLRKFGAILGDKAQTGCNSVTNPGTILLPEVFLSPNKSALGIISS